MTKLITALILLGMLTASTIYTTHMHIVETDGSGWCQLEDDTSVAVIRSELLAGSTEAGTEYIIIWDTNGTAEKSDDTPISAKEI